MKAEHPILDETMVLSLTALNGKTFVKKADPDCRVITRKITSLKVTHCTFTELVGCEGRIEVEEQNKSTRFILSNGEKLRLLNFPLKTEFEITGLNL